MANIKIKTDLIILELPIEMAYSPTYSKHGYVKYMYLPSTQKIELEIHIFNDYILSLYDNSGIPVGISILEKKILAKVFKCLKKYSFPLGAKWKIELSPENVGL